MWGGKDVDFQSSSRARVRLVKGRGEPRRFALREPELRREWANIGGYIRAGDGDSPLIEKSGVEEVGNVREQLHRARDVLLAALELPHRPPRAGSD